MIFLNFTLPTTVDEVIICAHDTMWICIIWLILPE